MISLGLITSFFTSKIGKTIGIIVLISAIVIGIYWFGVRNTQKKQEVISLKDEIERIEEAQKVDNTNQQRKRKIDEALNDSTRNIHDVADELSELLSHNPTSSRN